MRTRTLFAAVGLTALTLLAACGDDSSSDSAGADTTAAAVETTAGSADTTADTEGTDTTAASNGGSGDFTEYCGLIQQYMDESDSMDSVFNAEQPDPAQMEDAFTTMKAQLQDLADQAPDEIADDVNTVNDATAEMIALFDAVDYDVTKLATDAEAIAKFQELTANTEFNDAASRLDEWGVEQCGFES